MTLETDVAKEVNDYYAQHSLTLQRLTEDTKPQYDPTEVTFQELCEILGIAESTLRAHLRRLDIPARYRAVGQWRRRIFTEVEARKVIDQVKPHDLP